MIREMQLGDLEQVLTIEQQIFSKPWSNQSFRSAFEKTDNIYLVSEENGEIQGYLGIWCGIEDGDLCNMAVSIRHRRRGIASDLLMEGIRLCRQHGVMRILLEVRESNEPARKLYERYGFQSIGMRYHYYTEPVEDAVIMERQTGK